MGGKQVPKEEKSNSEINRLLDVRAIAGFVATNPSLAARVTPATGSVLNANGLF